MLRVDTFGKLSVKARAGVASRVERGELTGFFEIRSNLFKNVWLARCIKLRQKESSFLTRSCSRELKTAKNRFWNCKTILIFLRTPE